MSRVTELSARNSSRSLNVGSQRLGMRPPAVLTTLRVHGQRHLRARLDPGFTHAVNAPDRRQPAPVLALRSIRYDLLPPSG